MLSSSKAVKGFTLIEIIVGIVVLAVALVVITSALGPLYKSASNPWHQVRAAELGHSLLNEIMGRSFDENSDRAGGEFRCGEAGFTACSAFCTNAAVNTAEAETRPGYDDVDDFNGLQLSGSDIVGSTGNLALNNLYLGYQASITVACAGSELTQPQASVKKITVTITTPTGEAIAFSAYRSNW
jgi:MSHA pilin protein MshD